MLVDIFPSKLDHTSPVIWPRSSRSQTDELMQAEHNVEQARLNHLAAVRLKDMDPDKATLLFDEYTLLLRSYRLMLRAYTKK